MPGTIALPAAVTVICGLNGSGKSRLLAAIARADASSRLVVLSELVWRLRAMLESRGDIDGLLEETEPQAIDDDSLEAVQALVGRDYEHVSWYAVSIEASPFDALVGESVIPVFVVRHQGATYDSLAMGSGELGAHLLIWLLAYDRREGARRVLLDEPDAYLPAPARTLLVPYLADFALRRQASFVIATHALEVIDSSVDLSAAVLLEMGNGPVVGTTGPDGDIAGRVGALYGRSSAVELVAYCEDEAAQVLLDALLKATSPAIWRLCRIIWGNGVGTLDALWRAMPRPNPVPPGLPRVWFVADGDQANHVAELVAVGDERARWPYITLPGDPDTLFKHAAIANPTRLSEALGLPPEEVAATLGGLAGRAPHDWVDEFIARHPAVGRRAILVALASGVAALPDCQRQFAEATSAL
jgi:energy-coupling factor transporter ATP-binding protein EcfA2